MDVDLTYNPDSYSAGMAGGVFAGIGVHIRDSAICALGDGDVKLPDRLVPEFDIRRRMTDCGEHCMIDHGRLYQQVGQKKVD